ncbi:hypothetical protein Pmani_003829 [Petrolisthes manimaculis]|uniref:Uncharacterized protein n=1 Tax=Petrolisthes manimaculis TaxID=1843537 RepID=A0AAE1QFS4_9EUCA|nr:hypothetical protein Pmani_003829 [Petrolisthes manimaculis]
MEVRIERQRRRHGGKDREAGEGWKQGYRGQGRRHGGKDRGGKGGGMEARIEGKRRRHGGAVRGPASSEEEKEDTCEADRDGTTYLNYVKVMLKYRKIAAPEVPEFCRETKFSGNFKF